MSVTVKVLLAEAESLKPAIHSSEARRRTIVGRAYYAAYHAVLEKARCAGYSRSPQTPSVHADLIHWTKRQAGNLTLRTAGQLLETLRRRRVRADYYLSVQITPDEARDSLQQATFLIDDVLAA